MNKQLLLKVDNKTFNNDQELLKYVMQNYVTELEERDVKLDELIHQVKAAFPDFKVSIEHGKGWYCDFRILIGNELMSFVERLGNTDNPHVSYSKHPDTIKEVIDILKHKQKTVQYIIDGVNKIGKFKVKCTRHSDGYSPDEETYEFTFQVDGTERYTYYYPYNKTEDEFIKEFYQFVLTSLEGNLKEIRDEGYFAGYEIDGVPIGGFEGKRVRLELI